MEEQVGTNILPKKKHKGKAKGHKDGYKTLREWQKGVWILANVLAMPPPVGGVTLNGMFISSHLGALFFDIF